MPRKPPPGDPRHYAEDIGRLNETITDLMNERDRWKANAAANAEEFTQMIGERDKWKDHAVKLSDLVLKAISQDNYSYLLARIAQLTAERDAANAQAVRLTETFYHPDAGKVWTLDDDQHAAWYYDGMSGYAANGFKPRHMTTGSDRRQPRT